MSKKPLISIIIPYHKKKEYFTKTVNSIQSQTYKKFEVILVYDDVNLDDLSFVKKQLKKFKEKKIIINKKIIGPGYSRNKGVFKAKGKFIAFCDADDVWKKDKLKIQLNFMNRNKLLFSHTSYNIINLKDKKIGQFNIKSKIYYEDLLKSCDIGLSTVIMSKSLLIKKKFCKLKTKEDYFLWLKIIRDINVICGLNNHLVNWRYLQGSLSDSILQKIMDAFKLYYLYEKNSIVKSFYLVIRLSFNAFLKKYKNYNL